MSRSLSAPVQHRPRRPEDGYCPHCHLLIERSVGGGLAEGAASLPALPAAGRRRPGAPRRRRPSPARAAAPPGSSRTRPSAPAAKATSTKEEVRKAIRQVAEDAGQRPERLLMVDYQQRAADDDELPRPERRLRRLRQLEARAPGGGRVDLARAAAAHRPRAAGRVPPSMQVLLVIGALPRPRAHRASSSRSRAAPAPPREAYLTRGGRLFTFVIVLIYVGARRGRPGRRDRLARGGRRRRRAAAHRAGRPRPREEGKTLFIETCKSCHTLAAVEAHGVTGPDLDDARAGVDKQRVLNAIKNGGTGRRAACPRGCSRARTPRTSRRYVARSPASKPPLLAAVFPSGTCAVLLAWPRRSKPKPRPAKGRGGTSWPSGQGRIEQTGGAG